MGLSWDKLSWVDFRHGQDQQERGFIYHFSPVTSKGPALRHTLLTLLFLYWLESEVFNKFPILGYNPGDSVIFWNLKCIISVTNPLRSGTGLWFQQLLGTGCREWRCCWLLLCSYHSRTCCHCWENHPQVASSPVIQTGPEAHCVHIGLSFSILCLWELTMLLRMVFT